MKSIQNILYRWLRSLERYTKTDMVYLFRGGAWSVVGQGASVLASLLLAIVVSHFVSKDTYGIYKYILSVVTLISLLSLNSLGSAVFQSAAQGFNNALIKGFWLNIRWSVGIFVATVGVAGYYFFVGNTTLAIGVLIGGSFSPLLASAGLFSPFLGGKKDFFRLTTYGITDNVIPIILLIGVILFTQNPIALVATYFVSNTLAGLYFYRRTLLVYQAQLGAEDTTLLSYSKHLSLMNIAGSIANNIDQILLFHFVGAAQLAVYNFATAIPDVAKGPVKNIDGMLQARFVARSGREIQSSMNNKLLWYFLFGVGITLVYVAAAPYIFALLFPTYTDAVWYSQLYMLWIIPVAF